ncbi:hypothetical protein [Pseudophaeobacter sp.]|uniref:hypothetical protein n=1 Tax=Pseudophaeobacter sp. TaxID=1971739 RepID=UPI003298FE55
MYICAFCFWQLQISDRKTHILTVIAALLVLSAVGLSYAFMYHDVDIGPFGFVAFIILFGLAIGVFRYLPQLIARDWREFQFIRP